jgi:hypothetical protein
MSDRRTLIIIWAFEKGHRKPNLHQFIIRIIDIIHCEGGM